MPSEPTARARGARQLVLPLLALALSACDQAASRDGTATAADRSGRTSRDTVPATTIATVIDTLSGLECDDRLAPLDAQWEAERRRAERDRLAASAGRAMRDGHSLILTLPGGRRLAFVDCFAQSESWRLHTYDGVDTADRGHVLTLTYYEGGITHWVHAASGALTTLASAPVFSPDGAHFAFANADLVAGYTDNIFAIYRVTASGAESVYREEGGDAFGAATPIWDDNRTVRFTRVHRASALGEERHQVATVTEAGGVWGAQPEPPPPSSP